jgi:predicted nucleotidyltransferase
MTINTAIIIAQKYRQYLEQAHIPVEAMYLFGSYASKTNRKDSDIDICVISSIFGQDRQSDRLKLMKLKDNVDDRIEPHPFSADDFNPKINPLVKEIQTKGLKV